MTLKLMTTAAAFALVAGAASAQNMIDTSGVTMRGETVTFAKVDAAQDGYLVLHDVENGEVVTSSAIGHTAIKAGENVDIPVTSDMALPAGKQFAAAISVETNGDGAYEAGTDALATEGGSPVVIKLQATEASAAAGAGTTAADQTGVRIETRNIQVFDTRATFPSVTVPQAGFIVLFQFDEQGQPISEPIGSAPVQAGTNENVTVETNTPLIGGGEEYLAGVYMDTNGDGVFDSGDMPVMYRDAPYGVRFSG